VSVSQDIIYRRAINERVDHLMHVHNMFLVLNQLTKNKEINVFKYILKYQTGFHGAGLSVGG
jgi:hypothetical protein